MKAVKRIEVIRFGIRSLGFKRFWKFYLAPGWFDYGVWNTERPIFSDQDRVYDYLARVGYGFCA